MSGRVAVIAVHGVADQLPFATARATADLLMCRFDGKTTGFHEEQLRLEVQPLRGPSPVQQQTAAVQQPATQAQQRQLATQWKQGVELACENPRQIAVGATKRDVLAQATGGVQKEMAAPDLAERDQADSDQADKNEREEILKASAQASLQYFEEQISEYRQQPADAVYETVCLSATIGNTHVDVHEMYWADLSRVRSSILHAVEELYYVLFAVCNIGRMELERSAPLFTDWRWRWLRWWEGFAERILIVFVPLTNACLLLLLVYTLPHLLPDNIQVEEWSFLLPMGLGVGLLAGGISFALFSQTRPARAPSCLWFGGFAGLAVGLSLLLLGWRTHPHCIRYALSVLLWIVCAAVLIGLAEKFNRRQPGARWVSIRLAGAVLLAVIVESIHRVKHEKYWAVDIGLATAEWVLVGLTLMWMAYLVAAVACSLLGWLAVTNERKSSPRRETAERIVWTANLAILMPGMLFIILNIGIWQALHKTQEYLIPKLIPPALSHQPAGPYARSLQDLVEIEDRVKASAQSAENLPPPNEKMAMSPGVVTTSPGEWSIEADRVPGLLIRQSALPMFVVLAALVLMLLSAAWLLLPAILSEGAKASDPDDQHARQLGDSLSDAWRGLRWWARPFIQWQVFALIAVSLGVAMAPSLLAATRFDLTYWLYVFSGPALMIVGWLFVALATGVIQYAGLRTVVDVAADVANWLRLHPRDDNPTSRISARYVSLLRYIAQRKDEDDKDDPDKPYYDRVVIFAHSLGSVITVDLLRFLKEDLKNHPELYEELARLKHDHADKQLPIDLFTHGCPLRQLLGLRLPITYGWAWHGSNGWQGNEEPVGHELLGVKEWVNAYCSGDYVGRHLWHDDDDDTPWKSTRWEKPGAVPRVEMCVGAGAHVHYWDAEPKSARAATSTSSAPSTKVADELLRLIG